MLDVNVLRAHFRNMVYRGAFSAPALLHEFRVVKSANAQDAAQVEQEVLRDMVGQVHAAAFGSQDRIARWEVELDCDSWPSSAGCIIDVVAFAKAMIARPQPAE